MLIEKSLNKSSVSKDGSEESMVVCLAPKEEFSSLSVFFLDPALVRLGYSAKET